MLEDHQPEGPGLPQSPVEPAAGVAPVDADTVSAAVLSPARKTNTYGAVGIALAVLLWVYILGRIMVGSAGLNAALYFRRENRGGQAGGGS